MNFKKNYKRRCLYNVLIFNLIWGNSFVFAQEDLFKSDSDVFNDEEFSDFIKKRRVKNTTRGYVEVYLPVPVSIAALAKNIYDNNLNIIENETISTGLSEEQKKEYIIFDEITKYNETHPNSQINDCFKIKDENLLNDYMARYEVNGEKKFAAPIYFTNLLKFATIMGKINEYNNKNTECEFGLEGLEGEIYKNILNGRIHILEKGVNQFLKIDHSRFSEEIDFLKTCLDNEGKINLDEDKKKKLEEMDLVKEGGLLFWREKIYPEANCIKNEINIREEDQYNFFISKNQYRTYNKDAINLKICHLKNLEKEQERKEVSEHMTYEKLKLFKSLIYYNFNWGASNTFWINKRIGWEVDFSGSFSYFDLKKSVFLTNFDKGAQTLFKGVVDMGNGNLGFGLLNGHILNQNILKQESEKKTIDENGKYCANFMGAAAGNLCYCQTKANNTRDCATNFFVTKKFILGKQPSGCFNIGCNLKQINVCLKTGIAINLSSQNLFIKNYRGNLFNNSHQLVFNVGCIANINFWNLNLNFDIDEKALQYEGRNENIDNYNLIKENYNTFLNFNNIKETVNWLKNDLIRKQFRFRPMFEIKYRLDSAVHVSFEVGLRFIFRSALNFDIDKAGMQAYWETAEIPKYDNNTTKEELQERRNRILENIKNFGIKWFYNFDMCLFFSIGFNFIL